MGLKVIIVINIKDWTLWSVPSPELQLFSPTFLWSSNCSSSLWFVCFWRESLPVGQGILIHEVSRSQTTTHHSRLNSSGRVINPSQRPLPDNTQHSQQTNIHAPGGIRTQDLSRRAAADLRLRPRGDWDRPLWFVVIWFQRDSVWWHWN